mmetsp:Transcript_52043/g.120972  ORF Transcript_52043/g.120972 Transcript_52043/m.120972 type:complete len:228 (-) Transcript_52043:1405-2088(-)
MRLVGGDGCHHGGQANQRVERSNRLRQRDGLNLHANARAHGRSSAQQPGGHGVALRRDDEHCRRQAAGHAAHAELATHLSSRHAREATDGANAEQLRDDSCAFHRREAVEWRSHQCQTRDGVQGGVVFITRALEEVEHALRDDETSHNVDSGGCGGQGGQGKRHARAAAQQHHTTEGCRAGDGIGHGHEGRVQCVFHAPHNLVARCARQREGAKQVTGDCCAHPKQQ